MPRTDAIWKCIVDAEDRITTREQSYALREAAKNGIEELERQNAELLDAAKPALNYIEHVGANWTERGEPHPQQWIVDRLRAAIAKAESK